MLLSWNFRWSITSNAAWRVVRIDCPNFINSQCGWGPRGATKMTGKWQTLLLARHTCLIFRFSSVAVNLLSVARRRAGNEIITKRHFPYCLNSRHLCKSGGFEVCSRMVWCWDSTWVWPACRASPKRFDYVMRPTVVLENKRKSNGHKFSPCRFRFARITRPCLPLGANWRYQMVASSSARPTRFPPVGLLSVCLSASLTNKMQQCQRKSQRQGLFTSAM